MKAQLDGLRRMAVWLTDPQQLRALVGGAAPALAQAVSTAPPDARPDVMLLASMIADYRSSLESAGYDVTKLPPDMVTKLQSPPVVTAMTHLDSWAKRVC